MSKVYTNALEFIQVWERADSVEEAAESLHMTVPTAKARATFYKKKGIKLRKFSSNTLTSLDIAKINSTIDKIRDER